MMENPTPKKTVLILKGALKSLVVMEIVERVAKSCPPTKLTTTFVHDVDNVCVLEAQLFNGANQKLPRRIIGDNRWFPAHAESLIKIMKSIWFGVAFSDFVNIFNFIYMGIQRLELWKSEMYCNEGLIIWGPYHGMIYTQEQTNRRKTRLNLGYGIINIKWKTTLHKISLSIEYW